MTPEARGRNPAVGRYGNHEIDGWTNTTYLGRFALGASRGPWRFWDGKRFQMSPLGAAPLHGPDGRSQSVDSIPEQNPYLPRAYWDGNQLRIAYSIPGAMPRTVRVSADAASGFTNDDRTPRQCTAEW